MTKANPLPFTKKELDKLLSYDPVTGALSWKVDRGRLKLAGREAGFISASTGAYKSKRVQIAGHTYRLSRLAWLLMTGDDPGEKHIDHVNGDPLDNCWSNLRIVNNIENSRNRAMPCTNKSGRSGVSWRESASKWRAQIDIAGKRKHLGHFDRKQDAINARKKAEKEYGFSERHGE